MIRIFNSSSQKAFSLGYLLLSSMVVSAQSADTTAVDETAYAEEVLVPSAASRETLLDTVVVTASGYQQQIKEAPASISIITREELESKPFNNLGDALEDVEGIDVTRGGKAGGLNISIRGMPSDYTLILIDGKRVNQSSGGVRPNGFGDVDTNFIPPLSAIERIEVVRGPMSTLYGSDAMGGVINIITKRVANEWTGSVKVGGTIPTESHYGGNAETSFYLSGPLKEDTLGVAIRGGVFHRDNSYVYYQDKSGETKKLGFSGLGREDNYNIGAKFSLKANEHHDFVLDLDTARQRFDNSQSQLGTLNTNIAEGRAGGGYAESLKFNRDRASLTHYGRWNDISSETSLLYDTTETVGRLNPVTSPVTDDNGTPRDLAYDNWVFDTKWFTPLANDKHMLTVGGQYWKQKLKDTLVENPIHHFSQYQWALFAEDEWRMVEDFALTLGMRYDKNQEFGDHWSPRAYAVWSATPNWTFKGGVSRAYKTPRINQMVDGIIGFGGQGTIPLLGNSELKPETSTSSEIGAIFDSNTGFVANVTLFHTDFKDKIETQSLENCRAYEDPSAGCMDIGNWVDTNGDPIASFSKPFNIGKATIKGVEFGTTVPLWEAWTLSANYTFTKSEQKTGSDAGHPLGSEPRHMANAKLNWKPQSNWNIWLRGEYRAKQYNDLTPDGDENYYKPYTLVHLGTNYTINEKYTLAAALYNLTNKNFIDYRDNPVNPTATSYANRYYQVLEGRRLWLTFTASF